MAGVQLRARHASGPLPPRVNRGSALSSRRWSTRDRAGSEEPEAVLDDTAVDPGDDDYGPRSSGAASAASSCGRRARATRRRCSACARARSVAISTKGRRDMTVMLTGGRALLETRAEDSVTDRVELLPATPMAIAEGEHAYRLVAVTDGRAVHDLQREELTRVPASAVPSRLGSPLSSSLSFPSKRSDSGSVQLDLGSFPTDPGRGGAVEPFLLVHLRARPAPAPLAGDMAERMGRAAGARGGVVRSRWPTSPSSRGSAAWCSPADPFRSCSPPGAARASAATSSAPERERLLPLPIEPARHFQAAHRAHRRGLALTIAARRRGDRRGDPARRAPLRLAARRFPVARAGGDPDRAGGGRVAAYAGRRFPADHWIAEAQQFGAGGWTTEEAAVHLYAPALGIGLATLVAMPGQLTLARPGRARGGDVAALDAAGGADARGPVVGATRGRQAVRGRVVGGGAVAQPRRRDGLAGTGAPPPRPAFVAAPAQPDPAARRDRLLRLCARCCACALVALLLASGWLVFRDLPPDAPRIALWCALAALWLSPLQVLARERQRNAALLAALPLPAPERSGRLRGLEARAAGPSGGAGPRSCSCAGFEGMCRKACPIGNV